MPPGFLHVLSVAEVVERLSAVHTLCRHETVSLEAAAGRVLAAPVVSACNVPPADRAGMDGFAVRAEDTFGAGEANPVWLDCIGHVSIDEPAGFIVGQNQCAGVVTGSHMPAGADAVAMVEHTREFGAGVIEIRRPVAPGEYIMLIGEDATTDAVALPAGTLLRAQEIGLLAAIGQCEVRVFARPVAHVLSTGDELIPAHESPAKGQIRDVNTHALAHMIRQTGAIAVTCGIVQDQLDKLIAALHQSVQENPDVLFLSGGSSVGVRDLTLTALESLNDITGLRCEILCNGVALSPGKPLILAQVHHPNGTTFVWGLPGQVASAQVVMAILGAPFLRHLCGHRQPFDQSRWPLRRAVLTRNTPSRQGREDYVRVRLEFTPDTALPRAVPVLGLSGLLRTLIHSHGLMRIPAPLEGFESGAEIDVLLLGGGEHFL